MQGSWGVFNAATVVKENGKYFAELYTGSPEVRRFLHTGLKNLWSKNAILPNRDWRGFRYRNNGLFDWLIRPYKPRSFNYYTAPDGERFWMNYTFFDHRPDIWYQVTSSRKGPIQSGYTTVGLAALVVGNTYAGRIDFDVEFDPATHLPKKLYLYPTKNYKHNYTHRGFLSRYQYNKMPSRFSTDFRFLSGHKNF